VAVNRRPVLPGAKGSSIGLDAAVDALPKADAVHYDKVGRGPSASVSHFTVCKFDSLDIRDRRALDLHVPLNVVDRDPEVLGLAELQDLGRP
jgi:hypothetical protein